MVHPAVRPAPTESSEKVILEPGSGLILIADTAREERTIQIQMR